MWIERAGTYVNFQKDIDDGTFDVADGDNGNGYTVGAGDNNMSVGLPGTASGVITVGAYLQEKPFDGLMNSQWTDINGVTYNATDINEPAAAQVSGGTVGQRTPFSSIGPTADGRIKPDILAPGDPILSTLASGYRENYVASYGAGSFDPLQVNDTHFKMQGTSQAAPNVAGLVALLMEKNNTLTADQVKNAIINTGSLAMTIGKVANNEDGYGTVNAVAAINSLSTDHSGYAGTGDLSQSDLDGGGSSGGSSGGCGGTIANHSQTTRPIFTIILLAMIAPIVIYRRIFC